MARFIGSANLIPVAVEKTRNGRALLRLPGGAAGESATRGHAFADGQPALLMIRPERLALSARDPGSGRIAMQVTCTDLVYQGAMLRCVLRDAQGGELTHYLEASRQEPGVRPGATLFASWEPDAARLLHPDAGPTPSAAQN